MLSLEGCERRRSRLWEEVGDTCDFLILADPVQLIRLTNFAISPFEFRGNEGGGVAVLTPGHATLVTDNLLRPSADAAHVDEIVAPVWYEAKRSAPPRRGALVRSALEVLADIPGLRIGIEFGAVPAGIVAGLRVARPHLELVDLDAILRSLRRSKDPDELALLRRSMKAGDAAHAKALEAIRPGMTEQDAFRIIQEAAVREVGEPALVYGDFVSGRRTGSIGGPPTSRTIARGDLFLLDLSVVVHGYRGDFANTFAVGSQATPWQRERFATCLEALNEGEAKLKPGTPCREVDEAVRGHFAKLGLASQFPSHSGHGLGLGHPEPPYLVRESDEVLGIGDVVALEPGLYLTEESGMRFERNYLITSDGFETLSGHRLTIDV